MAFFWRHLKLTWQVWRDGVPGIRNYADRKVHQAESVDQAVDPHALQMISGVHVIVGNNFIGAPGVSGQDIRIVHRQVSWRETKSLVWTVSFRIVDVGFVKSHALVSLPDLRCGDPLPEAHPLDDGPILQSEVEFFFERQQPHLWGPTTYSPVGSGVFEEGGNKSSSQF